ncbi:MAG TPA: carboxypeptidase regulatory-like domain-containing protein [Longimicrobiales bacterium]|nr:carboxypeptidase regulatory-like domain-containing protein [Longimicrobiales bacterium]
MTPPPPPARRFRSGAASALLLVLLTGTGGAASAQDGGSITGLVFQDVTGAPVPGATVALADSAGVDVVASVVTDAGGRFSIPVRAGRWWLLASRPGFAVSPPQAVQWEGGPGTLDGVLLNLRPLETEGLAVESEARDDPGPARVLGRVLDEGTGAVVAGATVELVGSGLSTLSDENGMFAFPEVPPGLDLVRVTHIAYGEHTRELVVEPGNTYRVQGRLAVEAVELEGLEVSVTSRSWFRQMDALRVRMSGGLGGSYVLADELERRGYPPLAETLREISGVQIRRNRFEWTITIPRCVSTANNQQPVIYLDGIKVFSPGRDASMEILQTVSSIDVEAVEVYRGAGSVPAEFSGSDAACGVVAIWTKRGG